MRNVWAVIKREYLQRVRSRWFVFATVGGPVLMLAAVLFPIWYGARGDEAERRVAVVDETGVLADAVARRLEEGGLTVVPVGEGEEALAEMTGRVATGEISGYLLLDRETLRSGEAAWYGNDAPSPLRTLTFRQAVVSAALETQLADRDVDAALLLAGGDLRVQVLGGDDEVRQGAFVLGFAGAFLLYMVILLYAVSVMRATLEEKTSRVVEIIVSAMKPWHLMLGKILGVGAVGLTQLAVWATVAVLLAGSGIPMLVASRPEVAELAELETLLPGAGLGAAFVALFVFGYFLYSGLYAAVGAMCNSDEEAQQAQLPVMVLVVAPMVVLPMVMDAPASPLATGLSLIPFFSPVLLWPRMVAGAAAGWEVALAFALMAGTVVGVAWVAGRIYRVGILMAGKRPTLPELWRWIREA